MNDLKKFHDDVVAFMGGSATGGISGSIPVATKSRLGGIKVGDGLYMTGSVLNVDFPSGVILGSASSTVNGAMWYEIIAAGGSSAANP